MRPLVYLKTLARASKVGKSSLLLFAQKHFFPSRIIIERIIVTPCSGSKIFILVIIKHYVQLLLLEIKSKCIKLLCCS